MGVMTDCLHTTIRNVSGRKMKFSFLPPHGKELDDQEEFSVLGDLVQAVIRDERVTSKRHLDALERALANQLLTIVSTPNPILYDEGNDASVMLQVSSGVLGAVDPCFSTSDSG